MQKMFTPPAYRRQAAQPKVGGTGAMENKTAVISRYDGNPIKMNISHRVDPTMKLGAGLSLCH